MLQRPKKSEEDMGDQKVRAKRIDVQRSLIVESRTIGAPMVFALPTENLSRTGLLLAGSTRYRMPFQVNTLLEMTIDTTGSLLDQPLSCLGKIVRVVEKDQKREFFGVQIIHMDTKEQLAWDKAVAQLETGDMELLPA